MSDSKNNNGNEKLHRGLKGRHLQMIAIGGSIGTGLFLAMGGTIKDAGPGGAMVAYMIMGVVVYYIGMISYASIITLFVQILVGGVLYILLSGLYMVITKDQLLISVIHKIKKSLI